MHLQTHLAIDQDLCGTPEHLDGAGSRVALETTSRMAADDHGLVHGGFIFGLADYAAMIAVNDPNVVLGGANVKFLRPVRVGERVVAEATIAETAGKKRIVPVVVRRGDDTVFQGEFTCFVLDRHVLADT